MATNLTPERLEQLRAQARASGRFIDPAQFRRVQTTGFHPEWATAVLGRPYPGVRGLADWEIALLALALDAEPDRPVPAAELACRAAVQRELDESARRRAERAEVERAVWHALRDRLPVPVTVGHNHTIIHTGSYQVGRDHIVVQAELRAGRLYRPAGDALCETPAMRKRATRRGNRDPLRGLERTDDGKDRVPTCRACLRTAERIAGPPVP